MLLAPPDARAAHAPAPPSGRTASCDLLATARLAPERERRRIQQEVVLAHLDLADAVARRYRGAFDDWRDARQVAYVGLTKAVQRFEPERGGDLVAFAVPTISGEIKRHLRDASWMVRPPRQLQERSAWVREQIADLEQRLGREPTLAELADAAGLTRAEAAEAVGCMESRHPASLDAPAHEADEGGGATLGDTVPDEAEAEAFGRAELRATLEAACRTLTPREQRIVHLRFVDEMTQSQIAAEFGVTQMQISRILARVLGLLREQLTSLSTPSRQGRIACGVDA